MKKLCQVFMGTILDHYGWISVYFTRVDLLIKIPFLHQITAVLSKWITAPPFCRPTLRRSNPNARQKTRAANGRARLRRGSLLASRGRGEVKGGPGGKIDCWRKIRMSEFCLCGRFRTFRNTRQGTNDLLPFLRLTCCAAPDDGLPVPRCSLHKVTGRRSVGVDLGIQGHLSVTKCVFQVVNWL